MNRYVLIVMVLVLSGCKAGDKAASQNAAPPSPSGTPRSREFAAAYDEDLFQSYPDRDEQRAEARETAADFVRANLAGWEIKGVKSELLASSYRVAVDLQRGDRRETLDLLVERFFPDEGEPYWKARLLTRSLSDALHYAADAAALKKLKETEGERDELEQEKALREERDEGDGEPPDPRR